MAFWIRNMASAWRNDIIFVLLRDQLEDQIDLGLSPRLTSTPAELTR